MTSKITKAARDQTCTIRLSCCNGDIRTTVFCHYRSVRLGAGTALKPADYIGAFGCSACHDVVDGRCFTSNISRNDARFAHAEGCLETFGRLVGMGLVKI